MRGPLPPGLGAHFLGATSQGVAGRAACSPHARSVSPRITRVSRGNTEKHVPLRVLEELGAGGGGPGTEGSHVAPGSPRAEGFSRARPSPCLLPRAILAMNRSWPADRWPGHTRQAAAGPRFPVSKTQ